ncbi:MAG: deoxyhypusine synthase [Candidatus Doudnabacteria bacterium CG10_big_fil_rev_8_21_14_0_10_41_10]|uniref:Deoxyhypusine synthase n=1 Tax=Candidatus Doudnabacteria bacterium CG10_big_fil_rev_8_21_14_0_10_41_10 TaxID=1974551 RepID=A0A2H0VD31_9BACT|nr:MAG: deoxyhypusine synthase [Candidatus Doudnabacteria bacterium CG10_big_fil_rev_8_21_14_0_10_41_10]
MIKYNEDKIQKVYSGADDGFDPLHSLDLDKVTDFDELATEMKSTAFGGRALGEAADILREMVTDKDTFVVGTFSGAMTAAKMGLLICEMIDRGMINAMVSTGALMTHGMVEGLGMSHFKYKVDQMTDKELREKGYDRIYDTLELEKNLDDLEGDIHAVLSKFEPGQTVSSHEINEKMGEYLISKLKPEQKSILKSAYKKNIPVYIPAFSDSEYGLDFALFNRLQKKTGKKSLVFDPFGDLEHFTSLFLKSKKAGIFTVGGGVPRNWAQQVAPFLDLIRWRDKDGADPSKYFNIKDPWNQSEPYNRMYSYGVRICPEPAHWGGLSGCTYSEGSSWGKFMPVSRGGKYAEVIADATIAWPVILKAVMQRMDKAKKN